MARPGLFANATGVNRKVLQEAGIVVVAGGKSIKTASERRASRVSKRGRAASRWGNGSRQDNVERPVELCSG